MQSPSKPSGSGTTGQSSSSSSTNLLLDTPTRRRLGFISTSHLASLPPDSITTLQTLIADGERLEDEAREAMPWQVRECSYEKGRVRQEVFACRTCEGKGVCYACSVSCHADHDLVELFARRSFQCDCPTSYPSSSPSPTSTAAVTTTTPCSLHPSNSQPLPHATNNIYTRNFRGEFCRCERGKRYDPVTETESMVCCIGCEDWFHEGCLNLQDPSSIPVQASGQSPLPSSLSSKRRKTATGAGGSSRPTSRAETPNPFLDNNTAGGSQQLSSAMSKATAGGGGGGSGPTSTSAQGKGADGGVAASVSLGDPSEQANKAEEAGNEEGEDDDDDDDDESPILPSSAYEHLVCRSCVLGSEYLRAAAGHEGWMMVVASRHRKEKREGGDGGAAIGEWKDQWDVLGREGPRAADSNTVNPIKKEQNGAQDVRDSAATGLKRKAEDDVETSSASDGKKARVEDSDEIGAATSTPSTSTCTRPEPLPAVQALLAQVEKGDYSMTSGDLFIKEGLREKICACERCKGKVPFPLVEEETYQPPEEEDEDEDVDQMTVRALEQLPRSQAIEGLIKFNQMKQKLKQFLEGFRGEDRVVGPEDIRDFMEGLRQK